MALARREIELKQMWRETDRSEGYSFGSSDEFPPTHIPSPALRHDNHIEQAFTGEDSWPAATSICR